MIYADEYIVKKEQLIGIADKLRAKLSTNDTITIDEMPSKIDEVSDKAFDSTSSPLYYYATTLNNLFAGAVFPENYEAVIKVKKAPTASSYIFHQCHNLKSAKLISEDNTNIISLYSSFRNTVATPTLETVDLSEYNTRCKNVQETFRGLKKLKSILGTLDLSECVTADTVSNIIYECLALEDIRIAPNSIKITIYFNSGVKLTKESLESIINGLSDDVSEQTVTLSLTAVNNAFEGGRDGSEWQTLIASKPNWTIAYV